MGEWYALGLGQRATGGEVLEGLLVIWMQMSWGNGPSAVVRGQLLKSNCVREVVRTYRNRGGILHGP